MVKTALPMQGALVQSLVRELRSHMPHGMAKKKKKGMVRSQLEQSEHMGEKKSLRSER